MKVYARMDGKLASWEAMNASGPEEARGMVESCIDFPPKTAVLAVVEGGKVESEEEKTATQG